MANRELLAIRSERIKAYYTNCYIAWEQELNARGLALKVVAQVHYRADYSWFGRMPYQVVPGLAVITLAFTLTGAGIGFVNRWYAKGNQKKLILRDDWDHLLDARDKRLKDRAAWEAVLEKERQQQH
ncbi:hypothetical protein AaE_005309 [Aphanomyces astaci]|uniref:Uncharacterized protein n=1 Tax=Aphanomyces astaci TaxID=112090 RepID=A0A6A5AJB7_APHAT|nr:hypothetical protein AaE_005309 [Aphanomyces astaci]